MSQKRVETTANFVQKIDSMKMAAKLLETKANFTSKQDSMKMEQKLLEAKAKFTQKQDSLTGTDKTFSTVANFSNYLDNLKDSQRTFGTIAAFNDYTTGGISGDNRPCANAIADFNDYNWYEIQNQNSLGVWAYGKVYFNEYEDLTGATWEHTTGEGRYSKASGGVYAGGRWHNIAQYASGTAGAPAGQLFIAREAGPELVGTLGGHTAVMNNNQIVASVSAGVARAIAGIKFRMSAPRTAAASAGSLDDLAERFAERMARVLRREDTGGSTDRRPIVVQMVLDGRVIGEKSVEYIRDEAKRGNFPLAEAI